MSAANVDTARGPADVKARIAAVGPAQFRQPLDESGELSPAPRVALVRTQEHADAAHLLRLLRVRRERPRGRAAEQRDELPASHSRPQGSKPRTASSHSRLDPGMGQRGCELRPIVLVWECRLWIPRPGQNRKSSESANAFRFAPESGPPICAF